MSISTGTCQATTLWIRDVEKDLNNVTTPQPTPAKDNLTNNTPKQKSMMKSLDKQKSRNIARYRAMLEN